jgi:glycerol dehydrogenase-like iron-containing ADH family enzyme
MANIAEVALATRGFFKSILAAEDAKVVKITKTPEGWEEEVEVYERSSFIKSLGLPTKVKDLNIYKVRVDENLEVQSYEKKITNQQSQG